MNSNYSQSNMISRNQSINMTSINSNDKSYKMNQNKPYLNKLQKLIVGDPEFNRVEYQLQMQLCMCKVKIDQIYNVGSDNKKQTFLTNSKNSQILESWISIKNLDQENKIEDVVNRGFEFNDHRGLLFRTGKIKDDDLNLNGNTKAMIEMLVCNICPGQSQLLEIEINEMEDEERKIQAIIENKEPDPGFDSFVIIRKYPNRMYNNQINPIQQNEQMNQSGNQNNQLMNNSMDDEDYNDKYQYDYILYKPEQVHAQYIVRFELDSQLFKKTYQKDCGLCGEKEAVIYCIQDKCYFCIECDEVQHGQMLPNSNNLNMKVKRISHDRIPLDDKPMIYKECPIHKKTLCELYCNTCKMPLCVYCKIQGSHMDGNDASSHLLRKIDDVYKEAILESKDSNTAAERRKNILQNYLREIDIKIQKIQNNSNLVEEQIFLQHIQALDQLKKETNNKIQKLLSDQHEVKRQFEQLEFSEAFLKYQQDKMEPVDYLNSYNRHQEMRQKLILSQSTCQFIYHTIKDDITLEGSLQVMSRNQYINSQNKQFTSFHQKMDQSPNIHGNTNGTSNGTTNVFGITNTIINPNKSSRIEQFNNRDIKK